MSKMRAKLRLQSVEQLSNGLAPGVTAEKLTFSAVCSKGFGPNGESEDNTFARYTPTASLTMHVNNPDLIGKFVPGASYYVDFTPADKD